MNTPPWRQIPLSLALAVMLTLAPTLPGCGGGGTENPGPSAAPSATSPAVEPAPMAPAAATSGAIEGTSCAVKNNQDVLGGLSFQTSHRINARDYGCLIVRKDAGHPVFDGVESARFEVRDGDCSASTSFDDCPQDRSRHEINETTLESTQGKTLVYTTRVYIPEQARFKPRGKNTLFLTQLNYVDAAGLYGTLAYLEVADTGELWIRTDKGFSFEIERQYSVVQNPRGKWIKIAYEVKSSAGPDGYLKVFVDDLLKVSESRATLPSPVAVNRLRFGIYNVFKSRALEPYLPQVVYFDGIGKVIR